MLDFLILSSRDGVIWPNLTLIKFNTVSSLPSCKPLSLPSLIQFQLKPFGIINYFREPTIYFYLWCLNLLDNILVWE